MEAREKEKRGLAISVRSFVIAIAVIFALMVLTYVLTFVIPGGRYERITDAGGNLMIDTASEFAAVQGGIPFWKWLLSPILVLAAEGSGTLIAVIVFLLVIGGVFNSLDRCGLVKYMLARLTARFGRTRYRLMTVVTLFFMAMGSLVGSFEECVPLVPIVVALSVSLGWDALTGIGMSLLAAGCGFAAGVFNPFTVGVAQSLAGLPMFSGAWLRAVSFVCIYALLLIFIRFHARKVERSLDVEKLQTEFVRSSAMDKALTCFAAILGGGIVLVLLSSVVTALQDYTMIIVAVMFLVAGVVSPRIAGMSGRELGRTFWDGLTSILPAVLMILMASSIKYTLEQAHVLDTILHGAVGAADSLPKWAVILFIYGIVLVMNFFIASGSAKAFMLMPLIVPLAQVFGISAQLCVMAYAFGDGFSNVFYPTNPALLISLGLVDVDYGTWFKWSWKFQMMNLLLTSALLLFGLSIGY
ncbi:MAG: Na+/H+ antiporter NhaC family protein [Eubacteriales bacterium]|nr:Na+/H+ antiporter NhaC family protein [Eubacteriales bacterium]